MIDELAIGLGARFWANKSAFTSISFKVVLEPGSELHVVRVRAGGSERVINVTMDKTLSGEAYAASQTSSPTGAFDLPKLRGIAATPGWSGVNEQGKPYYWRRIILAESDPVTVSVEGAAIEEYAERTIAHDPMFKYVLTEYSAQGEWATNFAFFGGGNMAALVKRTSGVTNGGGMAIPWLTIVMALLSFFAAGGSKPENRGKALALAGLAGMATYQLTHNTEWGRDNLGSLDGVDVSGDGSTTVTNPDGSTTVVKPDGSTEVTNPDGTVSIKPPPSGSPGSPSPGAWGALTGWLTSPVGQVTTGAAAAGLAGIPMWVIIGGIALIALN